MRAANALAAAAGVGGFDELRRAMFANQPAEHSGGFTTEDLLELRQPRRLTTLGYGTAVREGRYASWSAIWTRCSESGTQIAPFRRLDGGGSTPDAYDPTLSGR